MLLAGSHARAEEPANFESYGRAPAAVVAAAQAAASHSGGHVASVDDKRGTPTFYWAQRGVALPAALTTAGAEAIARYHLSQHAALYNLTPAAISAAKVALVHDTGRGGVIVVFRQYVDGAEVMHSDMKVLTRRSGELVAIGGSLHPSAVAGASKKLPKIKKGEAEAISLALKDLYGASPAPSSLHDLKKDKGAYSYFGLGSAFNAGSRSISFTEPARIKKVYYPTPTSLVPAYYLEIQASEPASTSSDSFAYVIAADDGRLLMRRNLTEYDAFQYRVWADPAAANIPTDGPLQDFTPHPTGIPDESYPGPASPVLISIEGFNTPLGGGPPDPWLPAGATETKGNNVDAYTDQLPPDGFTAGTDVRADVTAPGVFDRVYDLNQGPLVSVEQSKAATTQIFYTTNWLHDWWYDSGFNETAGVAQMSNFGRGGVEGDPLHAEAQDGAINPGSRNNANMNTPADGTSPRMQMYLWAGYSASLAAISDPVNANFQRQVAAFGATNYDLTAPIALIDDGTAPNTDGCEPILTDLTGKIALIDRGTCTFESKVLRAQQKGAVGVLIANNAANGLPGMGDDATIPIGQVTIGALGISQADGATLKAAIGAGNVTAHIKRVVGPEVDGTIDNTVVAHEWGHYLHHRLVNCGNDQCRGMSEGWGDFDALMLAIKDGDDYAAGTFGITQYAGAASTNAGYYGIRRLPYTRDMTKNPFTYKHVSNVETLPNIPMGFGGVNNAEVHNQGEVWAQMLMNGYTALLISGGHSFLETKRRMGDYVVAGMLMAPVDTTWTEQRDGILAAAEAADDADMQLLASNFALRGLGTCAVPVPRYSSAAAASTDDVVESYEVKGNHAILSVKVDDSVKSCDSDGQLDGDELGKVTIELANNGPFPLTNTTAKVLVSEPGVTLPSGDTVTFAVIPPFGKATQTLDIGLDDSFSAIELLNLDVVAINNGSCIASVAYSADPRVNLDDEIGIATTDTVDSEKSTWKILGTDSDLIWKRVRASNNNYLWNALDYGAKSDTTLESADIKVSANGSFVFSFDQAYSFETTVGNPSTYWDGAVVEITSDAGATWQDVSMFASPGYGGVIGDAGAGATNPLEGRQGYVGANVGYPAMSNVSLNFGTAFAGQTVRLRFRLGTDEASGAAGWQIDNMAVQGVDNMPFSGVVPDGTICNGVPFANAGPDQVVTEGDLVQLDASGSSDPDSDPLTYSWTQLTGTPAMLSATDVANPQFTAPDVMADEILTFQVTVGDGTGSAGDTVDIVVKANIVVGTGGSGGTGGTGATGGTGGTGGVTTGGTGGTGGMTTGGTGGTTGGTGGATTGGTGGTGGATGGTGGKGGTAGTGGSTGGTAGEAGTAGTAGAGGETNPEGGGCDCAVAGDDHKAPVQSSALAALAGMLGLFVRRGRKNKRERAS